MRSDKSQVFSNMNMRQKVTAGALVLILIVIIWQVVGLFGGGSTKAPTSAAVKSTGAPAAMTAQQAMPQPAELVKTQAPTSQREMELMQLQQETQAKYLSAVNELQMLKVTREIAETNQAIMAAQLATVTAQKNIVTMLAPQQQMMASDYGRGLVNPAGASAQVKPTGQSQTTATIVPDVTYTVISVSQLQYRWNAVLGYQGNLYNVSVGDVLPADGSVVKSINKSGVTLEKNGVIKKISLVPII